MTTLVDTKTQTHFDAAIAAERLHSWDNPVLRRIFECDTEPIKATLRREEQWDAEKLDRVELLTKCFLAMSDIRPEMVCVPTEEIDTFWHTWILDTRKYAEDMQNVFGRMIHHYPYAGTIDQADADRQLARAHHTVQVFNEEFGISMHDGAPESQTCYGNCGNSGIEATKCFGDCSFGDCALG